MRSISLVVLLLCSSLTYGQFSKGDMYLGGAFSFSTHSTPMSGLENISRSFSVVPSLGYFINENMALGARVGYSNNYSKATSSVSFVTENLDQSLITGFFARRYFSLSDKFFFTVIGSVDLNQGSNKQTETILNTTTVNKSKDLRVTAAVRPNFVFFPTPKWAFDVSIGNIGYTIYKDITSKNTTNSFNLQYGAVSLGVSYYFRKSE